MHSYISPQFKYMIFHIFIWRCILHFLRVYYELTMHVISYQTGLIVQLAEHCTSIEEVMGSNSVQA